MDAEEQRQERRHQRAQLDEVEIVEINAVAHNVSGTFKLTYDGATTVEIDLEASALDVEKALEALPTLRDVHVELTHKDGYNPAGGEIGDPGDYRGANYSWAVTFLTEWPAATNQKLSVDTSGLAAINSTIRALVGYGLTETSGPTHMNPCHRPKLQCLGIPFMSTDVKVLDPDTREECADNQPGEIAICGPQVFQGYWNNDEATAKSFLYIGGRKYFLTGDLGRRDGDGYFYITDRIKRMINASGYKVWPAEVEALMYRHPDIREACIISTPDPRRGESVKACVVLEAEASADEAAILAWCRENMAAYKVPREIELCEALPRSPTGKVMWRHLQEQAWADSADA